jgi:dihydroneopterin aldolase
VTLVVELRGLRIEGRHGVSESERARPQPFLYDVELELPDAAASSDRVENTVDYRHVVATIRELSDGRRFALLETMAATVASTLLERHPLVERARVRVRKPEVDPGAPVAWTAATAERSRR